ncbi:hypothetical protein ASE86_07225 [Sphingomonas sp. Leaf33]|uniref:hypothetical protein n=1 Tax=Sphingomonas sp. Leaf33 TaxID=1736215 RepID=UPI0006FD1660|nr:hypothetical protein [Sphingomonas sp. Leaf33]KQN25965.1 hypothetical protein ASE86_07225 [Sphingomonas sp. Leaf33]
MEWGGPAFVIAIIAITTGGWVLNNWIRARHGFEPTDDWGGTGESKKAIADGRKIELLTTENAALHGKVGRLEERIAVLERIATDPAVRTAGEIDALR